MYLANGSLLITFTLIIWLFRVSKGPNTSIDPDVYVDTHIARPFLVQVDIVPCMAEKLLRMMISPEHDV